MHARIRHREAAAGRQLRGRAQGGGAAAAAAAASPNDDADSGASMTEWRAPDKVWGLTSAARFLQLV